LPLPFIISATRQIVQGLQALHSRNKMHRDIKPANFLLNHIGQVKLADFGILGTADPEDQFMHTFCGTQMYMSPERLHGGAYGVEGDIWSLGLCLMVCATGKFPFTIDSGAGFWGVVSQITDGPSPRLPESFGSPLLQDFIDCCLIKDPSKRWSAAQLMQHPLLKPKNAVDARSSLGAWLQFHKPDQARRQQDLADIELLIEKTKIVPFQSEIDRNSALINLVSRVADQFGLPDPEKSTARYFCIRFSV
jgi:serine/threonine protein kinase